MVLPDGWLKNFPPEFSAINQVCLSPSALKSSFAQTMNYIHFIKRYLSDTGSIVKQIKIEIQENKIF
jgi:hypothetical protein